MMTPTQIAEAQRLAYQVIPEEVHETGARVRVVAGRTARDTFGPITEIAADPRVVTGAKKLDRVIDAMPPLAAV